MTLHCAPWENPYIFSKLYLHGLKSYQVSLKRGSKKKSNTKTTFGFVSKAWNKQTNEQTNKIAQDIEAVIQRSCFCQLTTCLLCAEARARPSSVQLRVTFISSTSSLRIFSFWTSCWLLQREREREMGERRCTRVTLQRVGGLGSGEVEAPSYTLAWLRSSSFSSASFWLLSSIPSTTSFSLRTSSCSFWLLIWRSATQYTNSDVSLRGREHKNTRGRVLTVQFFKSNFI